MMDLMHVTIRRGDRLRRTASVLTQRSRKLHTSPTSRVWHASSRIAMVLFGLMQQFGEVLLLDFISSGIADLLKDIVRR